MKADVIDFLTSAVEVVFRKERNEEDEWSDLTKVDGTNKEIWVV